MCVCICVCACAVQNVDVSIPRVLPHTGSTMGPEQRDVSRGLSTADGFAAGMNGFGGSRVHKIFVIDAAFKFIFKFYCQRRQKTEA